MAIHISVMICDACAADHVVRFTRPSPSLVTSRKQPTENPSGNVGLNSGAFLLTTELFERTNQIVAFPITWAAH